jgi:hypothetical protein
MKTAKKIFVAMLMAVLVVSNFSGSLIKVKAADNPNGLLFVGKVEDIKGVPGETVHVKLPVRTDTGYIKSPRITVKADDMPFTVHNVTYSTDAASPYDISYFATTYIEFDLKVKESAKIGTKKLAVQVAYTTQSDDAVENKTLDLPSLNFIIDEEKEPAQLTVGSIEFDNAVVGTEVDLKFTIKNEGEITAQNAYFTVEGYKEAGLTPKYTKMDQKITSEAKLAPGGTYNVSLPVEVLKNAEAGSKSLSVKMTYKNENGESLSNTSLIYVNIESNTDSPKIEIVSTKNASELKAGDSFNLVTTVKNSGKSVAKSIEVTVGNLGVKGFLPGFTTKTITIADVKAGGKADIKIPLIVSNEATAELKEVPITITYKDAAGVTLTTATTAYLEVVAGDGVDSEGKPNVVISNVSQSPDSPNTGARIDVSFDVENKSNVDITDIKVSLASGEANFKPLNSDPYVYVSELKGNRKTRITIPVTAIETITEGTNGLNITYEYKASGKTITGNTATLYVQNIQNTGIGASKPKLIISNYDTEGELRANGTFNFIFDIKNTHPSVDARNIKVTVSQAENIFSVTQGSNNFYITNIPAGETVTNTMELKVKSDATTKPYPVEITMEYEYEGAQANPTTGQTGETVKETISLQAIENTRPAIENIAVGSWDAVIVSQPTALTFDFYNMGKSPLNNVRATVEGDFTVSTGDMQYIGNIQAGSPEYVEMEIVPSVEGQAKGTLIITFEDSNGEEVEFKKEFETTVQGDVIPDPGDNSFPDPGVIIEPAKSPILPTFAFVLIQIVIVIIGIPLSRKMVLQLYRRKLRKQEEAE